MYLNTYYGNHFTETKKNTADDIAAPAKIDDVKAKYRKNKNA